MSSTSSDDEVPRKKSRRSNDLENDGIEVIDVEDEHTKADAADDKDHQKKQIREFAAITDTDEVIARTVLQDVKWNLETAIDVFYSNEMYKDLRSMTVMGSSSTGAGSARTNPSEFEGIEISVMSWNIDGLDGRSLSTRMKAVRQIIKTVNPDIVFLQEVVDRELEPIDRLKSLYNIYYSNKGCQYYTAILVSKMLEIVKHDVVHYQNSGMYRTLQIIEGSLGGHKVFLLNTHLESMKEHSGQRRAQFAFCMDRIREIIANDPNCFLFFGGDLNLRDDEVSSLPAGVQDAWVSAGSESKTKFTWDTRFNDNKQGFGARLRFDRLYFYGPLKKVNFSLEGRNRIRSCLCFPSDHWAINAVFS